MSKYPLIKIIFTIAWIPYGIKNTSSASKIKLREWQFNFLDCDTNFSIQSHKPSMVKNFSSEIEEKSTKKIKNLLLLINIKLEMLVSFPKFIALFDGEQNE